jgi:16S rRNA (cytidine1402-2'-O)-methyltransferase
VERAEGKLVLVATPIGNLDDLSPRMRGVLDRADVVLAEDTRRSSRIAPAGCRIRSYHDHNARKMVPRIEEMLRQGLTLALVTDAGMPGVSDPSFRAVRAALEVGAEVTVVPGPSAVTTALAGSGLPVDRFCFEGFLPRKRGRRLSRLREMSEYPGTLVYFVGPHHLLRQLEETREVMGDRRACVARELTKMHEEFARGRLSALAEEFARRKPRGEITLLVEGSGRG